MVLARRKGWIGIDLGPGALKVAQVERTRSGLRVAASVVMPRICASGGGEDAPPDAGDWTSRDLQAALSLERGFSGRRAACVLPMHLTDLHALAIPPARAGEQRAMIANELSSLSPGDRQQREFDYWQAESTTSADPSGTENVNVLSVPRKLVSRVAGHFAGARLSCEVVDGLPFVLARAMEMTDVLGPKTLTGAVDWGYTSATFCVVSGGRPLFSRHLRNGGTNRLLDALGGTLGLSREEAMQTLAAHGLPGPDDRGGGCTEIQEAIAEVTAGPLEEMVEELKKTFSYLQMQYDGIVPDCLCLLGDGATVKNVGGVLSEKIGLPVETWKLARSEPETGAGLEDHPALLGAAIALSTLAFSS